MSLNFTVRLVLRLIVRARLQIRLRIKLIMKSRLMLGSDSFFEQSVNNSCSISIYLVKSKKKKKDQRSEKIKNEYMIS